MLSLLVHVSIKYVFFVFYSSKNSNIICIQHLSQVNHKAIPKHHELPNYIRRYSTCKLPTKLTVKRNQVQCVYRILFQGRFLFRIVVKLPEAFPPFTSRLHPCHTFVPVTVTYLAFCYYSSINDNCVGTVFQWLKACTQRPTSRPSLFYSCSIVSPAARGPGVDYWAARRRGLIAPLTTRSPDC